MATKSGWIIGFALFVIGCSQPKEQAQPDAAVEPSAPPVSTSQPEKKTNQARDEKPATADSNPREPVKNEGIDLPKTINASPGQATRLGAPPKRQRLWTVRWKGARIDFGDEGKFSGYMVRVTGDLYDENGKVASTFQGQSGEADKARDILRLAGQVKIISKEHKASLFCDKVEYQPGRKLIRAVGNVRIESESGILDAGNEVLATPDLRRVATPNLF